MNFVRYLGAQGSEGYDCNSSPPHISPLNAFAQGMQPTQRYGRTSQLQGGVVH